VLDAGYRPRDIEVTSLGLEQAFIAITAEDDRANDTVAAQKDRADDDRTDATEPVREMI
jgi:ABC-2 type transport system ATP-binding protein